MPSIKNNHYIIILCGGTGPRLWPLSRATHPKQFLKLTNNRTLIENTILRAKKIVPAKNIFIVANYRNKKDLHTYVSKLIPTKNFLIEPDKKNTSLAILYATAVIKSQNPNAIIVSLPADHLIKNDILFKNDIQLAINLAENKNKIVAIGIQPTYPNPSFGYISIKKKHSTYYDIATFIEKPNPKIASKLIRHHAFWNAGMYIFSITTIENEFKSLQPKLFSNYLSLCESIKNPSEIKKIYSQSENIAIDYAISQKSQNMFLVPATFDWSDIGEWKSLFNQLEKNTNNIAKIGQNTQFIEHNSQNCLVSTQSVKLIGLVGVDNLAIIDTNDAILICNLDQSLDVRDLITKVVASKKTEKYFLKQNNV